MQKVRIAACIAIALASAAHGQVLYSQNFEAPVTSGSSTTGPGGFVQFNDIQTSGWQIQGGGGAGGVVLNAGVDANGVGGSQALFATWDHTPAGPGFFTFNQYTVYGAVNPAGVAASLVSVEMDLLINGSESANDPLEIALQNGGNDLVFRPTLANGAYTHVSFTLDQASNAGLFNPAVSSNLRIQHGAGGFGFDAGNTVRVDNIVIQVVPEPAALGMVASAAGFLRRRRV